MNLSRIYPLYALALTTLLLPATVQAAPTPTPSPSCAPGGVLTNCKHTDFKDYLPALLHDNMPYVIIIAVVLIVLSGVQYILSMGSSGAQGKAKERIISVLSGVIFYFLIYFVASAISNNVTL